jgi:ADP-heptose:LPS heptosyltransferase
MKLNIFKKTELYGKWILLILLKKIIFRKRKYAVDKKELKKILLFRLDQRIGNCLMLIPLIRFIKYTQPDINLHVLCFLPVAELFQKYLFSSIDVIWPYHQAKLLRNPTYFIQWFFRFRKEKYDLIISSHNPDNFSVSQALFGRLCSPKLLIGFDWQDSSDFYDIAISSSNQKHYCESQIDLWKYIYPRNQPASGRGELYPKFLYLSDEQKAVSPEASVLLWLGATGNKHLPSDLVERLYDWIKLHFGSYPLLAMGPGEKHKRNLFPEKLAPDIRIWEKSLLESTQLFSNFRLFISGDTGPVHLAVVLGLGTLTIFIDSNIKQYGYHNGLKHFSVEFNNTPEEYQSIEASLIKLKANMFSN